MKLTLTTAISLIALGLASAASAQTTSSPAPASSSPGMMHKGMGTSHPCKDDEEKFCANVEKGHGRKMACLKEHESDLSDACKTKLAERQTHPKATSSEMNPPAAH